MRAFMTRRHMTAGYLFRLGVEGVLDVALSHDAQVSDDFDGRAAEHVVLVVVERLTGRHHDGLSSMDAQRVNILHVTHLKKTKQIKAESDLFTDIFLHRFFLHIYSR